MKHKGLFNSAYLRLLPVLFLGFSEISQAAAKVALVLGNQSYAEQALKNPLNDAEDMAAKLKRLGFEVTLVRDATLQQMEASVKEFGARVKSSQVALFFYAGHGVQADGANYLIPVKAHVQDATDLRYKAMDVGYVLDSMENSEHRLNIVILDACRNNPFRSLRGGGRGLLNMSGPSGSIIAFATAPNNSAEDGNGRNGVYTKHILEQMEIPGIGIEEMFKRVRIGVSQETGGRQTPWENSSLSNDFCFAGCQQPAAVVENSAELSRIRQENDRLAKELDKMRSEQQANNARLEELRNIQKEKDKLEAKIQTLAVDHQAQQTYQSQLAAISEEKARLEQMLNQKNRDEVSRNEELTNLNRLGQEKVRLEKELQRYAQSDQRYNEQLKELERIRSDKERLEKEAKRYTEVAEARNAKIGELERVKQENDQLLSTLRQRDEQLQNSEAALRSASRGSNAETTLREGNAPLIVNP